MPATDGAQTHFGFRAVDLGGKQAMVDEVFHKVARRYDLINDLMSAGLHRVWFDDGDAVTAKSVIIATGARYNRLPLDRLANLEGAGIYYAATEIEGRYCKGTEAVIIGGGNSAGQAAMFLSRSARCVRVLVRGSSLAASMSSYLSSRLEADPVIRDLADQCAALAGRLNQHLACP